jgi:aminoglycoside phosphotransferase (APT) family kinase protein
MQVTQAVRQHNFAQPLSVPSCNWIEVAKEWNRFIFMVYRLHDNEIPIDIDLVRKLVDTQLPQYAVLSLSRLEKSGSPNVLFRLGDDLLVRLPRQPGGSAGIDKERRWLPKIGHRLPVAVPEIVAPGKPAFGFGERWSIMRWLAGESPRACPPDDPPTAQRSAGIAAARWRSSTSGPGTTSERAGQ